MPLQTCDQCSKVSRRKINEGARVQMNLTRDVSNAFGKKVALRLRMEASQWARTWKLPGLPEAVEVRINRRLRTTIARYLRDQNAIEVGSKFLALRKRKAEILAHEMAHAAVAYRFGRVTKTHGKEWQELVRAVGFVPQVQLLVKKTQPRTPSAVAPLRFEHRCPVCQMVRLSSRPVTRWRCRSCIDAGLTGELLISEVEVK